jgi:hypothetical protein
MTLRKRFNPPLGGQGGRNKEEKGEKGGKNKEQKGAWRSIKLVLVFKMC